jgi:hypothetical protein
MFAVELAEQCYEAARGVEPTLVPVWEGMAATAATGSAAGTAAAAASAEHAVGLGGGPESWLEYSVGELAATLFLLGMRFDNNMCHDMHRACAHTVVSSCQYFLCWVGFPALCCK